MLSEHCLQLINTEEGIVIGYFIDGLVFFLIACRKLNEHTILNDLFFELIRVAIGTQDGLSRIPTHLEWQRLFELAKKQSLVGVCFAALQRLGANADEGFARIGMSEMLFLTWMGLAAKIQQKNQIVDEQCVALQKRLSAEGMRSSILKGQGISLEYSPWLAKLRQSGDIDVWVDAPKKEIVAWAEKVGLTESAGYLHVGARCFKDTEVELHYRPTYCRCIKYNRRMQEFCDNHKDDWKEQNGFVVPSWDFNVVYLLSHIYRHLFGLGIGLRQLMDYYFVLRSVSEGSSSNTEDVSNTVRHLGLYDFAGAVMYVMRVVFRLEEQYMICPVDEKRGRLLLDLVMQTGSFGKMDKSQQNARSTNVGRIAYKVKQWWKLVRYYPEETLSAPFWKIYSAYDKIKI